MTPFRVSVVAAFAALVLLVIILELIRSRRLQERYAVLWLLTGGDDARSGDLARRARTDRRPRRDRVSTLRPLRHRFALHSRRAAPLLDRHLSAIGSEQDPRSAARPARARPRGGCERAEGARAGRRASRNGSAAGRARAARRLASAGACGARGEAAAAHGSPRRTRGGASPATGREARAAARRHPRRQARPGGAGAGSRARP